VPGWLRRFAAHAEGIRAWFTALAAALDPELGALPPAGSVLADAVEAVLAGGYRTRDIATGTGDEIVVGTSEMGDQVAARL